MNQVEDTDLGEGVIDREETGYLRVENIGGISQTQIDIPPGITVLTGPNATNRTSLLMALLGVLGGDMTALKSDKEEGVVSLDLDGDTYTRQYVRQNQSVITSGDPVFENSDIVDLFVGLIERNPARRAVERGDDLRSVIMRPVDTDQINHEIKKRERQITEIEQELSNIESERAKLPTLEERQQDLQSKIDDITAQVAEARESVDEYEIGETEAGETDAVIDELDTVRKERANIEEEIRTQRRSIDALEDERLEIESELKDLSGDSDIDELDRKRDRLQTRKRELEDLISDLSAIQDVNDDLLDSERVMLVETGDEGSPVSALDPMSGEVECWTCGSVIEKRMISDRVEEIRRLIKESRERHQEIVRELNDVNDRRQDIQSRLNRRAEMQGRLDEIDTQLERRAERINSLEEERSDLEEEIDDLESELEGAEEVKDHDLVEKYQRLSDLEYRRGQLEQQLQEVQTDIAHTEDRSDERSQLTTQRDELREEVASLRSRIGDLEASAVEQFNSRMADILDLLEYENIERVWIERKKTSGRTDVVFDLHVVRESDTGAVYEDSVDTLSESEREIIGLVVALAGYLVHEVYDRVPFMIIDSLEAIDAARQNKLIDYFSGYAGYLVVALLPEDADRLDVDAHRIPAESI